jgi:hypothetical protein
MRPAGLGLGFERIVCKEGGLGLVGAVIDRQAAPARHNARHVAIAAARFLAGCWRYKWVRRPALLLAGVLINRDR